MGDRSYFAMSIHDVAPAEAKALWEVLQNNQLVDEATIIFDTAYSIDELSVGEGEHVISACVQAAPSVVISGTQSGRYEYIGQSFAYSPTHGWWESFVDEGDNLTMHKGQIESILEAASHVKDPLAEAWLAIELHFGTQWQEERRLLASRRSVTPPVVPKFSTPDEATAWLEAQSGAIPLPTSIDIQ